MSAFVILIVYSDFCTDIKILTGDRNILNLSKATANSLTDELKWT
ncbi:hypothetical protein [Nostoc sp. JL31]|nr:hypothetical protein [Nostoc sp. JL31]